MPFLAAVSLPFLGEVVLLLVVCVGVAYLCYKLRLVAIVGFLLAGVLLGPTALGLIKDQDLINGMAEIGVILLLFTIGVEFSLGKLARIRRLILVGGGLQFLVTAAVVMGLLLLFEVDWVAAVYSGWLVALSSTAIVLKLMNDRGETDAPTGRFSIGILIFQDLAVVGLVLLVPVLGGGGGSAGQAVWSLAGAAVIIVLVLAGARYVVPPLLDLVARTRSHELFLLTVVGVCFGTAWLTSQAGVSLALGAFLAGLLVSESRYSHQALSEVLPLQTLFNAVFFVSVGLLLDLNYLVENLPLILGVAAGVLVVKALVTGSAVLIMGYPIRVAASVGLILGQIGEFSFVLERSGEIVGLSPVGLGSEGTQLFIAVTVLLMALTPLLVQLSPRVGDLLTRWAPERGQGPLEGESTEAGHLEDHVVIAGYGPAGQRLAHVLADIGLPFSVIEMNPMLAGEADRDGIAVVMGDAARPHILQRAGIERAKLCVVVTSDDSATARIVDAASLMNPTVQIIVRTRFLSTIEVLQQAGADIVVPEELETSVRIFTHVLNAYLVPADEINRQVSAIRSGDYQVFRGSIHEAHLMVLQGLDEEGLHTRSVAVRAGSAVAGRTLEELGLRKKHNLTVLAVRRSGKTIGNPSGGFRVEAEDRLVMVGTAEEFIRGAELFRVSSEEGAR